MSNFYFEGGNLLSNFLKLFEIQSLMVREYAKEREGKTTILEEFHIKGGQRGSNPRPSVPQTDALTN
jgi:hypothetical protein